MMTKSEQRVLQSTEAEPLLAAQVPRWGRQMGPLQRSGPTSDVDQVELDCAMRAHPRNDDHICGLEGSGSRSFSCASRLKSLQSSLARARCLVRQGPRIVVRILDY